MRSASAPSAGNAHTRFVTATLINARNARATQACFLAGDQCSGSILAEAFARRINQRAAYKTAAPAEPRLMPNQPSPPKTIPAAPRAAKARVACARRELGDIAKTPVRCLV